MRADFLRRRRFLRMMVIILCLLNGCSEGCSFMKPRLVTRGTTSRLLLSGRRARAFTFKPFITGYIGFVFLDCLVHLLRGQPTTSSDFGVKDMPYLLVHSIQRNLILERPELITSELIFPIFTQITHRGANSYQKVNGSLLGLLAEVLDGIPLLSKGEGSTIVFLQHLEESSQILSIIWVETADPIKYIRGISS